MKAVVFTEYGPPDVLQVKEVATPVPSHREVLIKIRATPLSFGDLLVRNFKAVTPAQFHMPLLFWLIGRVTFGLRKPSVRILGSEFAGEVAAVGKDVTLFKEGDQVFGYRGPRMGAYAEYLCMPESGVLAAKPANLGFAQAAAVPYGALMALSLLRKIDIQPGQKVLVNGASGGIGWAVVQLAKAHFQAHVTGVCGTARMDYVRVLGADHVVDYTKDDFSASGETYERHHRHPGADAVRAKQSCAPTEGPLLPRQLQGEARVPDAMDLAVQRQETPLRPVVGNARRPALHQRPRGSRNAHPHHRSLLSSGTRC